MTNDHVMLLAIHLTYPDNPCKNWSDWCQKKQVIWIASCSHPNPWNMNSKPSASWVLTTLAGSLLSSSFWNMRWNLANNMLASSKVAVISFSILRKNLLTSLTSQMYCVYEVPVQAIRDPHLSTTYSSLLWNSIQWNAKQIYTMQCHSMKYNNDQENLMSVNDGWPCLWVLTFCAGCWPWKLFET